MSKLNKTELFKKALMLHSEGKLDDADDICLSVLKNDTDNFAANYLHGCILSDRSKFQEAATYLKKALTSNPDNYEVNNNLGIVYKNLGETDEAETYFLKAISIDEKNFQAYFNCANLYADINKYDSSINFFKKAIEYNNNFPEAYHRLGEIFQDKYDIDRNKEYLNKSIEYLNFAISSETSYTISSFTLDTTFISLGLANLWLGNYTEANKVFNKVKNNANQQGLSEYIEKYLSNKKSACTLIIHEYEQLTFIDNDIDGIRNPKFTKEYYQELKNLYLKIKNNSFDMEDLTPSMKIKISKTLYNKPPKISSSNSINEKNDIQKLESKYLNSRPEVLIVDNFLTPEALLELQKFCRNANIFKYTHNGGHVGAYLTKGLSNEFILKLSEDLRLTYKNIFKDLKLTQAWVYKYESTKAGVNVHADPAVVNVNFWITPDHANLDKKTGGLKIWNKMPPEDWAFADYNAGKNVPKMKKFLSENKSVEQVVEYKENRAIIFNSKLFHATNTFNFNDKYEDRRINITFLYD
ncbi:MAG: tetratricopeptide repeat protein [Pelagibacterales bacterium]|jgi:tetratricopeptide (TPR) repeat protein|nr:tetratricopeptide repeat protein [Pelagibacterales bacterium]|tara:strand:- start:4480 stop:6054 length:1575 start_codon:yes stop_codon:yes gene_type:complete